ncbi:MAG: hypothetical protein N2383_13510, partial [Caldilineales bacterium]|nr:hypothetical protein [Caldilineales bacterium]
MSDAVAQLRAILNLEARRGYRNDAVVGGLDEYARRWHLQMAPLIDGEHTARRVGAIVDALAAYPSLSPPARVAAVHELLAMLETLAPAAETKATDRTPRQTTKPVTPPSSAAKPPPSPAGAKPTAPPAPPPRPSELAGLDAPLTSLPGVGPALARNLARLGLERVGDCLLYTS